MYLHSLIFSKGAKNVQKIAKNLTNLQKVREREIDDRIWIGFTLPDKNNEYKSKKIEVEGMPITVVFEKHPNEPAPFKKGPWDFKYTVRFEDKNVNFGDKRYEQYRDTTFRGWGGGIWRKKNHLDKERQKNYI